LRQIVAAGSSIPLAPALVGGTAATASLAALAADPAASAPAAGAAPKAAPVLGYTCFSQDEAAFVESMVNIMCPADEYTPNGVDCGLATYIDRQLAGDFGTGLKRYKSGPWSQGAPQQGYQLPLTPQEFFKQGLAAVNEACMSRFGGKPFDQISAADGDAFLKDLAAGKITNERLPLQSWLNELVYPLFNQACFADPIYGGNYDKVFWKMIGYPGLPATHTVDIVQFRGKPYPGRLDPKSIVDFS
jgi:gluconate 2-dehydrogenase gamma chain